MNACSRCGTAFSCGAASAEKADAPCWCTQWQALPMEAIAQLQQQYGACLCPHCLSEAVHAANCDAGE